MAKTLTVSRVEINTPRSSTTSDNTFSTWFTGRLMVVVWLAVTVKAWDQPWRGMEIVPEVPISAVINTSQRLVGVLGLQSGLYGKPTQNSLPFVGMTPPCPFIVAGKRKPVTSRPEISQRNNF